MQVSKNRSEKLMILCATDSTPISQNLNLLSAEMNTCSTYTAIVSWETLKSGSHVDTIWPKPSA